MNRQKQPDGRASTKYNTDDRKPCNRFGKPFTEGHLKNCAAIGKKCKNCNKPNHFARMCRSQQVNEITENTESSEEECNLIQIFDSCEEFEINSIEQNNNQRDTTDRYIKEKVGKIPKFELKTAN